MRSMRLFAYLLALLALFSSAQAKVTSAKIAVHPISSFKVGSKETRFGSLEFLGGVEISSRNQLLGAISGIRLARNRLDFVGVMDTGHWYKGRLQRSKQGLITGFGSFDIAPIRDRNGKVLKSKWNFDAEGIALKDDMIFVSFEQNARIDGYSAQDPFSSPALLSLEAQIPRREFRNNGGLEALAKSPATSPLKGAIVTFAERSVDKQGNLFAAILEGPQKGVFFVKRHAPYNITDADFLPNGDLILLERRFNLARGVGLQIRRIKGAALKKGALVDGEILLDVGAGYQIDNMEGLSITQDDQGQNILTLVSDDNHSFLQRNLILEFKLLD